MANIFEENTTSGFLDWSKQNERKKSMYLLAAVLQHYQNEVKKLA